MPKKARGARFDIIPNAVVEADGTDPDYILLYLPKDVLPEVLEHLQLCMEASLQDPSADQDPKHRYCMYLNVKAQHPISVGPLREGMEQEVKRMPSLLKEDLDEE